VIYAFAEFELDVALFQLRRRGEVVKLAPKAFDLLHYLLQHRDRVVAKGELLDELWRGEHVTEAVLPTTVAAIRKALQSGRSRPEAIQTVHGRGYRFVAPVDAREAPGEAPVETGLFVGRDAVMLALRAELDEVLAGRGRVTMLVGEPGIGKTRTAEELAHEARRRGARVAEARCHEGEGVPAFWPWVQILRALVKELPGTRLREQLGAGAADIAPLLPELRQRLPGLPDAVTLDSEQARFRLFDSIALFLLNASRTRPLLLLLDDLHWADEPSLRLLHFLVRGVRDARVGLLGTYRDVELRRQHPLAQVLGLLAKEPHFRRVLLRGLVEPDVGRFIEDTTGGAAPEGLVRAVFEMTEGNPFFVRETVRLLEAEGRLANGAAESWGLSLPQSVREVIGRRLDQLSTECNRVLGLAALMGREFGVGILEQVAELPRDALLERLEEALAAGIVNDHTRRAAGAAPLPLGHYAFAHALIRETLREEIRGPQRVRLHRRIAEVLEASYARAVDSHLPELAHHFFEAAPGGDVERAIDYGVRAAQQALELMAWEEGVAHYERALEVEELAVPADDARKGELVLGLAQALWRAGLYPRAREVFQQALGLARRLGDGRKLARAALGMGGWPQFRFDDPLGGPGDEYRALLEEALGQLGQEELALRARLVSRLADQTDMAARARYSEQAVALARESADPDALFGALYARLTALLGPNDTRRRLDAADELLALAVGSRSKEKIFVARESRIRSLLALGEIAEADREIATCHELAEELRLPIYRHSVSRFDLARALADGRFEEVERLNRVIRELGRETDDLGAELLFGLVSAWLRYSRGELQRQLSLVDEVLESVAFLGPTSHALAAFLYAELDQLEPARRHFEALVANGFEDLPRNESWLITLALASEACAELGDRKQAAILYELLLPYSGGIVSHLHLRIYLGSVDAVLARLATTCGERDRAAAHYEAALEAAGRMGARPHRARIQVEYARMLLSVDATGPGERRARELLASAAQAARELGMKGLLERTERVA
jgi:DNA-binding winged helix-turn-helix (wHTH) protein/tetratricopeptide (TPR) repeat protein